MSGLHEQLPPGAIRLLHLFPGKRDDPLECSLVAVSVDHAPPYEAVSYLWGSRDDCEKVKCRSGAIQVTANGAEGLIRLRTEREIRVLWMDQICINQEDLTERSEQVRLMSKIFSNAHRVLMWLGRDDDQLAEIVKGFVQHLQVRWTKPLIFDTTWEKTLGRADLPLPDDAQWKALKALFRLQYFTRVWMLQEVMLATDAVAFWGSTEMAWMHIARAASWAESSECLFATKDRFVGEDDCILVREMLPSDDVAQQTLGWMIGLLSYRQATDPRDKIFAIMDLVAHDERLPFTADYTLPTVDVYKRTTEHIIFNNDRSLKVMQNATLTANHPFHRNERWPTWVPRWGDIDFPYICGVDADNFLPCDGHPLDAWTGGNDSLFVKGITAGKICVQVHDEWQNARQRNEVKFFDDAWELTRRCADPTLDTEPLVLQIIWTLLCAEADAPPEGSGKHELQDAFRQDYGWSFINYYYWGLIRRGEFRSPKDLLNAVILALLGEVKEPFDGGNEDHALKVRTWMDKVRHEGFDPNLYASCRRDFETLKEGLQFIEEDVDEYACYEHVAWRTNDTGFRAGSDRSYFQDALLRCGINYRFFVTDTGRIGMSPREAQIGDVVAVLFGSTVPYLLRPVEKGYAVVGSCYCYTVMEGQYYKSLVAAGQLQEKTVVFELI